MKSNRKMLLLLVSIGLVMTLITGCRLDITPTLAPSITNELTPTYVPTEEPTPTLSPTPFVGTLDQEYRYRIELLDSTDGRNVQVALKDLDLTAKGQSDSMKDLLTANFLAWFKKGSFPRRETTISRFGDTDFKATCTDETIATLNVLLKDSALIAYPEYDHEGIYVHPAIYMIPDLVPNAMTANSKLFFEKYKKLEEQSYLLWGRDGPPPEIDFIYEALGYWEKYCGSIKDANGMWSFPEVDGLPPPWNPDGMLRMLRMKLIMDDHAYMFRSSDSKLSENYRYFFRKYIETYPDSETAEFLRRFMKAMEEADWLKNDTASAILTEYGLEYYGGLVNPKNPLYMTEIQ